MNSVSLHDYFLFSLGRAQFFKLERMNMKHFLEKGLSEKLKYLTAFPLFSTTPPGQIRMSCQVKYKQSSD